jgi:hypothetical protein
MDGKKINHIETSSRASSAVNFNSIDIDLGSNYDLSISNFGFDTKKSNTEGFLKVKSAKKTKKEKSIKDNSSEELITKNINTSTETPSSQSQHIYSIPLSNDISSLDKKDNNTEANYSKNLNEEPRISERSKTFKKLAIPSIVLSSLVLVIGVILGMFAAVGGNFL